MPNKATEYKLIEGVYVSIHPRTGLDQLIGLSVHLRLDETKLLDHLKDLDGTAFYKNNFVLALAQTEQMTGLDYQFPPANATPDEMAEGFLEFMALPATITEAWGMVLLRDEIYNASKLLPPREVPEADRKNPLSEGSEASSEKVLTAS